jgi:hypothetical protein
MPCIVAGFGLWSIGAGLKCTFGRHTPLWKLVVVLMVEGAGVGMTLQPSKSISGFFPFPPSRFRDMGLGD